MYSTSLTIASLFYFSKLHAINLSYFYKEIWKFGKVDFIVFIFYFITFFLNILYDYFLLEFVELIINFLIIFMEYNYLVNQYWCDKHIEKF